MAAPVVGITDTGLVEATSQAIGALEAQLDATHGAVHAVANAIVPPTNDSASGTATVQQLTNVNEFATAFRAGLYEMQKATEAVHAMNVSTMAVDAANGAAIARI